MGSVRGQESRCAGRRERLAPRDRALAKVAAAATTTPVCKQRPQTGIEKPRGAAYTRCVRTTRPSFFVVRLDR